MIPAFDSDGNLPPGIHVASWAEVEIVCGRTPHRQWLLAGLRAAVVLLAAVGCSVVYLDGSLVTTKERPNDYDCCWMMYGTDLRRLLALEPVFFDFSNNRAAQKARLRGEWFPAESRESASGRAFLQFFQTDKSTGLAKGIIALDVSTVK